VAGRKITGTARVWLRSIMRSNNASPLMPGMRTSSSRHAGWRCASPLASRSASMASKASALA